MISIRGLTKKYGEFCAVEDVSLEILPGETFAFLGPNGGGKSTTLKCIVGLSAPTAGEILVDGVNVRKSPREARRRLSYLPQRVSFPDNVTVREVTAFYGSLRRVEPSRVAEVAASTRFQFNGFSDNPVGTLSGGMIQRLGLLVACLPDVPLFVLDEPMINLDPQGAIAFRDFLFKLKEQGKTILFSSHMLADVEQLADRVGIFVAGRLASVQSVDGLRESLNQRSKMRLDVRPLGCREVEIARAAGAREASIDRDRLVVACGPEQRMAILQALECARVQVLEFATEDPSLEDFYLSYLRESQETSLARKEDSHGH